MKKLIIFVLVFLVLFSIVGWYFSNITIYFIFSMVIAAALRPLTNRINGIHILGQNIPRSFAILLSFSSIVLVLFLVGLLFIPLVRTQLEIIKSLDMDFVYEQAQKPVGYIENVLIKLDLITNEPGQLMNTARQSLISNFSEINIQGFLNRFITTTSNFVIGFLAVTFISFFLLLENGLLRRNILSFIPNEYFEISVSTFNKVERLLSNYLLGLLIQMSAIFSIATLGLLLVNVEYAMTIAIFAAVVNLIPYAGPVLGALFGILVGFSTGNFVEASEIYLFIFKILSVFAVVQLTDNVILQPLIFSKSVKAHPLEIFVIIFVGAKIAGVLGMVFAIPVYTIFRVSIKEFYRGYKEYRIFKIIKS